MFEAINRVASLEKMQVITAIPGSKVGGLRFFFRRFRTKLRFFKKTRKVSPSFLFRRSFRVDMIWHLFLKPQVEANWKIIFLFNDSQLLCSCFFVGLFWLLEISTKRPRNHHGKNRLSGPRCKLSNPRPSWIPHGLQVVSLQHDVSYSPKIGFDSIDIQFINFQSLSTSNCLYPLIYIP